MRNDYGNKPRAKKAKGGRTGKQFGGGLTRPVGGVGGVGGVGAPVRPLGFKGGARVQKVHGGRLARPLARPVGFKKGSKSSNVYNKKK